VPRGETRVVEHEVLIEASPETVFQYFTDPSRMVEWMGEEATLDPRPGGICRIVLGPSPMVGSYVEVVPYERVVFSWGWNEKFFDMGPGASRVEVTLTPEDEGTRVRLRHSDLPQSAVGFHQLGWHHYFERLRRRAIGRDPGPDALAARAARGGRPG
jgi:uncharacterized protein YndB with AHSA1/START domain